MTRKVYLTRQDEAWDAVAYRLWGQERLFMELVKANPEHLDTVVFPAGVELTVPERPVAANALELPPWRK